MNAQGDSSVRPEIEAQIKELELKLTAADSFRALCIAGCKPEALAGMVRLWAVENPVVSLSKTRTIHLYAMDDWSAALGDLRKRDLTRIKEQLRTQANKLSRLAARVGELQTTRLFRYMLRDGELLPDAQLLDLAARMKDYADVLMPKIVKACGGIGPKHQPDRNQLLFRLARYVKACTRRPHYQEISDLLGHFEPTRLGTLKKNLSRQGFTRRK